MFNTSFHGYERAPVARNTIFHIKANNFVLHIIFLEIILFVIYEGVITRGDNEPTTALLEFGYRLPCDQLVNSSTLANILDSNLKFKGTI
ncbi:hypothetical protein EKO27_g3109 [Xylaria grammica]|uniref:Uncharacterized protein n=1 Tax=Xylaria grammica TaxID=363999 RepID=A0A439DCA3_9PEZI|nr:hypothetical protein EKO27_g3109 [Xylaria grammica]